MHDLIANIDRLHTTDMGQGRIRRNLGLGCIDIVPVVRDCILAPSAQILRRGKNWYITTPEYIITVNSHTLTIITAHRIVRKK